MLTDRPLDRSLLGDRLYAASRRRSADADSIPSRDRSCRGDRRLHYVLTHLRKIETNGRGGHLVPVERGPRNNMVLIICAVPIVVMTLLLFLILKA
jgi:hypothetical protein